VNGAEHLITQVWIKNANSMLPLNNFSKILLETLAKIYMHWNPIACGHVDANLSVAIFSKNVGYCCKATLLPNKPSHVPSKEVHAALLKNKLNKIKYYSLEKSFFASFFCFGPMLTGPGSRL
jgi:hypothetical protein